MLLNLLFLSTTTLLQATQPTGAQLAALSPCIITDRLAYHHNTSVYPTHHNTSFFFNHHNEINERGRRIREKKIRTRLEKKKERERGENRERGEREGTEKREGERKEKRALIIGNSLKIQV